MALEKGGSSVGQRLAAYARAQAGAIIAVGIAALILIASGASAAVILERAPARLKWNAASGPVRGYRVQISRNGGSWTTLTLTGEPSISLAGPRGVTVRIRVAAFDAQGRNGPWSLPSRPFWLPPLTGGSASSSEASGSETSAGSAGKATPPKSPAAARLDLNGDGYDDLVWESSRDGSFHVWYMRGTRRIGQATLAAPEDAAARIAGAADFDGDGTTDLLFFDAFKGSAWISLLGRNAPGRIVRLPKVPRGLDVIALGTFDGGRNTGIFFRNASTGEVALWQVGRNLDARLALVTWMQPKWDVVAALDVDGNGTTDLLWRDPSTGRNLIWWFRRGRPVDKFLVPERGKDWSVGAVGDFNGDGSDDVFWRATRGGADSIWFGGTRPFRRRASSLPQGPGWQLVGARYLSGDGRADLVWQQTRSGANVVWRMAGASPSRLTRIPDAPDAWVPVEPR